MRRVVFVSLGEGGNDDEDGGARRHPQRARPLDEQRRAEKEQRQLKEKARREREALELKKWRESTRKRFEERMVRKAVRAGLAPGLAPPPPNFAARQLINSYRAASPPRPL